MQPQKSITIRILLSNPVVTSRVAYSFSDHYFCAIISLASISAFAFQIQSADLLSIHV